MKNSVRNLAILLSLSLAAASCTQLSHKESVSGQGSDSGVVVISDKNKDKECSMSPIEGFSWTYGLKAGSPCTSLKNDDAYYFRIDGVPSGVLITFYDEPYCSGTGNFVFTVRTTQSPTTTDTIRLSSAHGRPTGSMLAAGLRLESTEGSGQVDGKLSCVRIEY
ncbi:hypothetical protein [Pseudomonas sp. TE50-2]|uniref:hypothetical protein n=1 Tax=Pseudomonas sp. TE50-2 TaxID=3142707 RepID=UPI003467BF17